MSVSAWNVCFHESYGAFSQQNNCTSPVFSYHLLTANYKLHLFSHSPAPKFEKKNKNKQTNKKAEQNKKKGKKTEEVD